MALNWEREMEAMVLSGSEESLIKFVRMLPPDEARKVLVWAQQLAELGGGGVLSGRIPGRTTIFARLPSHLSNGLSSRSGKGVEAR
jgi:hypothetical protein